MVSLFVAAASVVAMAAMSGHAQKEVRVTAKEHRAWCLGVEMAAWLRTGAIQSRSYLSTNFFERVRQLAAPPDCYKKPCTVSDAADFYTWHWYQRLTSDLPEARVVLCRDGQAWQPSLRAFRWSCAGEVDESLPWVLKMGWPDDRGAINFYPSFVIPVGVL